MRVIAIISEGLGASATSVGNLFRDWKPFLLPWGMEGHVACQREGNLPWS